MGKRRNIFPTRRITQDNIGFGKSVDEIQQRLINHDGSFNIKKEGKTGRSAYQWLIEMSFLQFILLALAFFTLCNSLFAGLFMVIGIENVQGFEHDGHLGHEFYYSFFLSVQTFTTVGYGGIHPVGIAANLVASLTAFVGLIYFAVIAGLFLARFTRPVSHIVFSDNAIISPYKEGMSLQCRMVNNRKHKIDNLKASMALAWQEIGEDGLSHRRFQILSLEISELLLFPLNWTLVHYIKEDSPLFGKTSEDLKAAKIEVLVMVSGFDENYNQTIRDNTSYVFEEMEFHVKYKRMFRVSENGETVLYLDELSDTIKII